MSVHDELLGFLDGTLPADAEAELLHRMSVSPERRALLRSYFQQQSLIAQDKSSINVPYDAEQGLWAKLDKVMPPVPATMPMASSVATMAAATSAGFFTNLSTSSTALVAGLLVLLGFGSGYLAADTSLDQPSTQFATVAQNTSPSVSPTVIYRDAAPQVITNERVITRYITRYITLPADGNSTLPAEGNAIAVMENVVSTDDADALDAFNSASFVPAEPMITLAAPVSPAEMPINVGGEQLKPVFINHGETPEKTPARTVLERFEFSFNESFGKQYPNTEATNTTLPLITNSSLSTYFQVLPRSEKLWIGASLGTANVTRKTLTTKRTNALDPTEEEVHGEYVHVQTNWMGGFLQYRIPVSQAVDLTSTAGYGFATAGHMAIGELGIHVDATKDVGFTLGLRGTRLSYELEGEMQELLANRKGSLSVPRGVTEATPSYNLELATGLFFHF